MVGIKSKPVTILIRLKFGHQAQNLATFYWIFFSPIRYFVHTCIIIILEFSFFNGSLSQKKFVKVIEDGIYDKLLKIIKESEKFVLAKFYSNVDKKIWWLISNAKAKDKFNTVTGKTEFRLVG